MTSLAPFDTMACWQITLALLHVGWLGVGIAGLAMMGNWLLRKASAGCRYWVNFVALLLLGLCLPVSFTVVRLTSAEPLAAIMPSVAPTETAETAANLHARVVLPHDDRVIPSLPHAKTMPVQAVVPQSNASAAPLPSDSGTSREGFWTVARSLSPYITAVYALGVVAMFFKLIISIYGGQRLRAACCPVTDSGLLEIVARQAQRLGLRITPALTCCGRVAVPVVIGVFRPMIALPAAMISGLSPEQFSAIITHELAHLRRYDHLLILVQRFVEAIVFFHPAVWYLSRRVQLERENYCDDLVLATGADRFDFAESLLRIAELRLAGAAHRGTAAGLAADGPNPSWLRRRIARLLDDGDEPGVRLTRSGLLTATLVCVLLCGLSVPLLSGFAETKPSTPPAPTEAPVKAISKDEVKAALKSVPQVALTVRFVDQKGKPAAAWPWTTIAGWMDDDLWTGDFQTVPGKPDVLTAIVPRGLKNFHISGGESMNQLNSATAKTAFWWRWTPASARMAHYDISLHRVDKDYQDIIVEQVESASLEIRLRTKTGELPKESRVQIRQEARSMHNRDLQRVSPGIYRTDYGLLPDCDIVVNVRAPGFLEMSTKPLRFTEVGQKGVVELTLEPEVRTRDNVPVTLVTPEGAPIVEKPAKETAPGKSFEGRAVDIVTNKPVADAAVKMVVRQMRDETGQSSYRELETQTTKTDAEGKFTVVVPKKYFTDSDPLREVDLFVTSSHPSYATGFGFGHPRRLGKDESLERYLDFRLIKLEPAKEIYGQAVDAKGRPLANITIYKNYEGYQTNDAELPKTDGEGRFRTRVATRIALNLEFRTEHGARNYYKVPADRTDLGVIRIADGLRVSGRVLDAQGKPVAGITVNAPLQSKTESQPNFCYFTDKEGRFQTDKLSPGSYLVTVGGIYGPDEHAGFPIADAPGVYVPLVVEVREGQPVGDVTLRPTENVARYEATLVSTRPEPAARKDKNDEEKVLSLEEVGKELAAAFIANPSIAVRGVMNGNAWEARAPSFLSAAPVKDGSKKAGAASDAKEPCVLRVPKGLTDATVELGMCCPQHFQLDEKSPKLFGFGIHLDRTDRDLTGIKIYRYRETTLKVHVAIPEGTSAGDVKVEARYVREKAMRDAGAILLLGTMPFLKPEGKAGDVSYSVLPGEEIELSATVPGMNPAVARVQLKDGETHSLTMTPTPAK